MFYSTVSQGFYKEPIVKYLFTMLTIKSVKIWFKFLKMAGQKKKKMRLIIILLVMKMWYHSFHVNPTWHFSPSFDEQVETDFHLSHICPYIPFEF